MEQFSQTWHPRPDENIWVHSRLLYKLNYYGIRGNILHWLESFLRGHTRQVVVEGSKSSQCLVSHKVLYSVQCLIYINNIVTSIKSEIRLFADNILIYKTITTPNDHNILQTDLDSLSQWASDWLLEFNIPKCKILQFTTRISKVASFAKCQINPLDTVTQHNYLGVRLQHRLS